MPKLIKDCAIIDDAYVFISPNEDGSLPALPPAPVLVKLATWKAHRDTLLAHLHAKGLQLASDEFAETIIDELKHIDLVVIEFPAFADGRGYSTAYTLRGRLGFKGEIRAVGDVFKDTLFYQHRSGFNAFQIKEGKDLEDALLAFGTFQVPYQGTAQEPSPLYRHR